MDQTPDISQAKLRWYHVRLPRPGITPRRDLVPYFILAWCAWASYPIMVALLVPPPILHACTRDHMLTPLVQRYQAAFPSILWKLIALRLIVAFLWKAPRSTWLVYTFLSLGLFWPIRAFIIPYAYRLLFDLLLPYVNPAVWAALYS